MPHIATFDAAINVTASAVIQVKAGIGDVIWHLPFVRGFARRLRDVPGATVERRARIARGRAERRRNALFPPFRLAAAPRAQYALAHRAVAATPFSADLDS